MSVRRLFSRFKAAALKQRSADKAAVSKRRLNLKRDAETAVTPLAGAVVRDALRRPAVKDINQRPRALQGR